VEGLGPGKHLEGGRADRGPRNNGGLAMKRVRDKAPHATLMASTNLELPDYSVRSLGTRIDACSRSAYRAWVLPPAQNAAHSRGGSWRSRGGLSIEARVRGLVTQPESIME
jgi:hypothetical protein